MILSKRVKLGSAQLDELHDAIVIRNADPGKPDESVITSDKMGGFGSRLISTRFNSLKATVTFAIDLPKHRMKERGEVMDLINAWAKKGNWLYFTHLYTNRRMYVERIVLPNREDLWDWTKDYTIEFWNYNVPFWRSSSGTTAITDKKIAGGTLTEAYIEVDGTTGSVAKATFANISGKTSNDFYIKTGSSEMTLNGVNLASNETLIIDHKSDGTLRARAVVLNSAGTETSSRSVYGLITGHDDLYVNPGTVKVSVRASRAGRLTIENNARWL